MKTENNIINRIDEKGSYGQVKRMNNRTIRDCQKLVWNGYHLVKEREGGQRKNRKKVRRYHKGEQHKERVNIPQKALEVKK